MLLKKMDNEAQESLVRLRGDASVATKELELIKMNQTKASISQSMDKHNKKSFLYKCRFDFKALVSTIQGGDLGKVNHGKHAEFS